MSSFTVFDAATRTAGLVILAPSLELIGQATGLPALVTLAPLLGLLLLGTLLRQPDRYRAIQLNLLAAAVVAYALANGCAALLTLHAAATPALLAQVATLLGVCLTPVVFYFIGVLLGAPVGHSSAILSAQTSTPTPPDDHLGLVARRLVCALVGVALPLAGWAVAQAIGALRTTGAFGSAVAPPHMGLPDAATLANLLAVVIIVASASDAPNATLRFILGARAAPTTATSRIGVLLAGARRSILALCVPLGAALLVAGVALTWSRVALLATGAALLVVSVARRRYGRLLVFALLAAPVLAVTPRGVIGWFSASFVVFDANVTVASAPLFSASLAAFTVMGLALARLWVAYGHLRPTSGAAGVTLAALGVTVYLLIASMTSSPLNQPGVGVGCWLLLGLASGVADALERAHITAPGVATNRYALQRSAEQTPIDGAALAARAHLGGATRGYPLRLVMVVDDAARSETQAALAETLRTFDRRRVIPHLITLHGYVTPAAVGATGRWALVATWRRCGAALRQWADLIRVILDAQPDLLVASSPHAFLPTTFVGRLIGVPVQWHAREIAAARQQRALDTFAPWATGIVACSQYVAQSFQLEALGSRLCVVRMGVEPPSSLSATERQTLRAALGVDDATPLIIYPGALITGSGHLDLIQAMQLLRARYPQAQLVLASESGVGGAPTHPMPTAPSIADCCEIASRADHTEQRLRCAIALNCLDDTIHLLGPRADLARLVGAADLAVFPQASAPLSRGLTLALAQGTPIVAVQSGALPEQIADAWGCLLAAPHDPAALADALADALGRLGELRRDARHNRSLAHDWQSAAVEVARLQTLYRQICLPAQRKGGDTPTDTRAASHPSRPTSTPAPKPIAAPDERAPAPLAARSRAWATTLWSASQSPTGEHTRLT